MGISSFFQVQADRHFSGGISSVAGCNRYVKGSTVKGNSAVMDAQAGVFDSNSGIDSWDV